ncbi:exodeoxyribonuclease VII large subunit, partial [Candidatus Saccharibacteria bacterium]|nr:exodeoxyribonuclease VII large subunit [Candidatus Saccharibacteria bacterium]
GEGSIKKASDLLREKLKKEGLFEESRKKYVTSTPQSIGLITSLESAAYQDFIKIINNRWTGLDIHIFNVGVQGVNAVDQNIKAVEYFNALNNENTPDLLVITRGGGSKDDLSVYDDERLVRAIAISNIPTVVAVGHEVDVCLAELVADKRASTPSNAAELLTPDKQAVLSEFKSQRLQLDSMLRSTLGGKIDLVKQIKERLNNAISRVISNAETELHASRQLLSALNPEQVLKRGYSVVRYNGKAVGSVKDLAISNQLAIDMADGQLQVTIDDILKKSNMN